MLIIFFYSADEAFHERDPFFSRPRARRCAGRRLDRANRPARFAALILGAGVICWVAGFDLIYATQDSISIAREGLRSLVVKLGVAAKSAAGAMAPPRRCSSRWLPSVSSRNWAQFIIARMPLVAAALFYEHRSARKLDLAGDQSRIFPKQRFCQRGLPRRGLSRSLALSIHAFELRDRAARDGRLRNPSSTRPAQSASASLFRDHAFAQREHIRVVVLARESGASLRSSKARNAPRAPCSPPSPRRFPSRQKQFRDRIRRAPPLPPPVE